LGDGLLGGVLGAAVGVVGVCGEKLLGGVLGGCTFGLTGGMFSLPNGNSVMMAMAEGINFVGSMGVAVSPEWYTL